MAALATGFALVLPAGASANDWTGVSIGVGGGVGMVNHELSLTPGPQIPAGINFDLNQDGIGGDGGLFTVGLGADLQVSPNVVIGAFFDYDATSLESQTSLSASLAGLGALNASLDVEVEEMWSLGARAGYLTSPDTLWYVLAAYTQADVSDIDYSISAGGLNANGVFAAVDDFSGFSVGGGVESRITQDISLKAEYRYTQLDSETIELLPDDFPVINDFVTTDLEPTIQTGRISINYRFNFHEPVMESFK